ncbi:PEP-CTERM sorting domain-containing protein [Thalassotalea agarivorans]|uniref:PEP-CTERM protein-sorting domain-containing protein n=1 Tax=Thalassotalea agarivorans TaxID=349064 RepID=A0A1I0H2K7_THASX|nr:PEP-CTERM sorting domain-containing protein [Thalassotalea agarivorans]SET77716.1 PEP-CTERM protein-sorting domain-containing protein [Thalassotalea agarivorans]
MCKLHLRKIIACLLVILMPAANAGIISMTVEDRSVDISGLVHTDNRAPEDDIDLDLKSLFESGAILRALAPISDLTNYTSAWDQANCGYKGRYNCDYATITHVSFDVDAGFGGILNLDLGLDAGFGAEVHVSHAASLMFGSDSPDQATDLWWRVNWGHNDVFNVAYQLPSDEIVTVDLFFAERCCFGVSTLQTSYIPLPASAPRPDASVPEPSTLAIFALGLLGLASRKSLV